MRPSFYVRPPSGRHGPTDPIPPSALRRSVAERVMIVALPIAALWGLVFLSLVWWR